MPVIGIIAEYNPFHNGHLFHIDQIKKQFPNSIIILVLNGYFLERGEISLLSKRDKTRIALEYGVNLVLELPVLYGTQAADIFAEQAITILNYFGITHLVFGSECNNPNLLLELAECQQHHDSLLQKEKYLKQGLNYPTALSKAISSPIHTPNDLLGISYAKAILKHQFPIELVTILRTNDYHKKDDIGNIVSASTIRKRIQSHEMFQETVPFPVPSMIQTIDEDKLWLLLRFRLLTDNHLEDYLTVDEGIEIRLQKMAFQAHSYAEFISLIKTKRYTYNKIRRMIIHILLGITKKDNDYATLSYIHILGFDFKGQAYLRKRKENIFISLKPESSSKIYEFEKRATYLYEILTNSDVHSFEFSNHPIIKSENSLFDK